jgi:hypothetical protein
VLVGRQRNEAGVEDVTCFSELSAIRKNMALRSGPFSVQDLELLGYSNPKEEKTNRWSIFSGTVVAGPERMTGFYLYLKANFTNNDAERACTELLSRKGRRYIVVPQSEEKRRRFINELVGGQATFFVYEELVWKKITEVFSDYITGVVDTTPRVDYYVPPREERADDPHARLDIDLFRSLTETSSDAEGQITVIRAPAGVGKTTLSRELTLDIAKQSQGRKVIPAYVEAEHWDKLKLDSLEGLWEVIENSLRKYSLRITKELFEYLLRQGYLAFIFDGFDELCDRRFSRFAGRDVLNELIALSTESSAKIVITTRPLFWEGVVGSEKLPIRILDLAPFNKQQALAYFRNVFKEDVALQKKAQATYEKLVSANKPRTLGGVKAQFVNHPICVQMIADELKRPSNDAVKGKKKTLGELDASLDVSSSSESLLYRLLWQLCDREQRRRKLRTSADKQMEAFQQLAIIAESAGFELSYCGAAGFDERDLATLKDHPLLAEVYSAGDTRLYSFRYGFLKPFFRARVLVQRIRNIGVRGARPDESTWQLMSQEAASGTETLEHMSQLLVDSDIQHVAKTYSECLRIHAKRGPELSFIFHIMRLLVDEPNQTKKERTDKLFGFLYGDSFNANREVRNLYVIGQVDRLDITSITFRDCTFADVTFTDCVAGAGTRFRKSVFSGNFDVAGSDQISWKDVEISPDCILEFPTNLVWERLIGTRVGKREEHVRDAIRLALGKFWHHGQPKLTITKIHWRSGTLGHSIYCDAIRHSMLRAGLLSEIPITGVHEGGYLFAKARLGELQRFMDNGQLTGAIREVYDDLLK